MFFNILVIGVQTKRICANGGAELSDLFFYSQVAGVKSE